MKQLFKKLFLGLPKVNGQPTASAIQKRIRNIRAIWNNEQDNDIGIEKLLRLFLALSQFLFAGIYIKEFFGRKNSSYQDLSMDFFVVVKVVLPIITLYYHWQNSHYLFALLLWFLFETLLYVPTLIFASDTFLRPRSYRRSMLLLFLNYTEIVLSFGVIYSRGNYLNQPLTHWYDPIYFSVVTFASIGYGDYYPVTATGKFLVSVQSAIFLTFIVLFINFFSNKVTNKGYFNHKE